MKVNIKKVLGIGAGAVVLAATSILALLNSKDEFTDFLENASDDELEAAREKVRLDFCNPDLDDEYRTDCQNRLHAFDNEMSKRAWGDETPLLLDFVGIFSPLFRKNRATAIGRRQLPF